MTRHNFDPLFSHYPGVIAQMESEFTSHQFILKLAQAHQQEYIAALQAYCGLPTAPFRRVHSILARHLNSYPELVTYVGMQSSVNIFGEQNACAVWRKVSR